MRNGKAPKREEGENVRNKKLGGTKEGDGALVQRGTQSSGEEHTG